MKYKKQILFIIALCILSISLYNILKKNGDYQKSETLYQSTREQFITKKNPENKEQENDAEIPWYDMLQVDWEGLQSQNGEIVAWLYFENEDISYPILQARDNEKYLHTAYTGETMVAGSLFLDYQNYPDFSDFHSIIYGHNMRNLSMFGRLKYYKTKENYLEEHAYFQIHTPTEKLRYLVTSYQDVEADSAIYTIFPQQEDSSAYQKFLNQYIIGKNVYVPGTTPKTDYSVTLSTCTASDKNRFVVNGVCIDTVNPGDGVRGSKSDP